MNELHGRLTIDFFELLQGVSLRTSVEDKRGRLSFLGKNGERGVLGLGAVIGPS